jgi:hypothetical protein
VCFLGYIPVLAVGVFGGISCRIVVYLGYIPVLAVGVFGGISSVFFGIHTGFSCGCVRWDNL